MISSIHTFVISPKRIIIHQISSKDTLRQRLSNYFGNKAQHCKGIPMSSETAQIQTKNQNITIDHINNTYYSTDCKIIRDQSAKTQCTKCRNLMINYKRSRQNALNSPIPKNKTAFSKYTTQQLFHQIRNQSKLINIFENQIKQYQRLFNKYQTLITVLDNNEDFNNFIRFINKHYIQLNQYFEKYPKSLSFLHDQFRYMLLRKDNKTKGMRWRPSSILLGMYIRIHLNIYKLFTESNVIYLPSLRTLDKLTSTIQILR